MTKIVEQLGAIDRVMKQRVHFDVEDIKEIKDWEIGKDYKIELQVTMRKKADEEGKPVSASFEINKVKSL